MDDPFKDFTIPESEGRYYEGRKVFGGRFILKRKLGQGGMGQVWLAADTELAIDVALKFTSPEVTGDTKAVVDLRRAVALGRELTHPGIVRVFDFHADEREAAISMEYMPGKNLYEWQALCPKGFFEAEDVCGILAVVCEVLDYAHQVAKCSHRDIKPKNIMFDDQTGTVKVADFDIGRRLTDTYTRNTGKESSGSLPYMGPQQMLGKTSRVQDDVYSLGATIYELLTGTSPFYQGDIREQIKCVTPPAMAQRRQELMEENNIASLGEPIPAAWERAVAACLHKEREHRPASAGAVLAMVNEPVADAATPQRQGPTSGRSGGGGASPPEKSVPPLPAGVSARTSRPKKRAKPILISLGVMALIGLIAWGTTRQGNSGRDRSPSGPVAGGPVAPAPQPVLPTPAPTPVRPAPAPAPVQPTPAPAPVHPPTASVPPPAVPAAPALPTLSPAKWESLAASGDAYAQALLARHYLLGGTGQPSNRDKAIQWAEKSASQNHPLGLYMKGILAEFDPELSTKEARSQNAKPWYEKASKAGFFTHSDRNDAQWMERLGGAFFQGRGVAKDETEAVKWYQKAADLGEPRGMSCLGVSYAHGKGGLKKDETEAVKWYQKAADLGEPFGMVNLGAFYSNGQGGLKKDESEAVKLFQKAADLGDAQGMEILGVCHERGQGGLKKDESEAVKWYQKAADLGDPRGMTCLGVYHERGQGGLKKDASEAVKWYQKAADLGDAQGMANLGVCYRDGAGTEKNPTFAFEWFEKAAKAGSARGMTLLGLCYENGTGTEKSPTLAFEWYDKAAKAGDEVGMTCLGVSYENGTGTAKSPSSAVKWYQKAADLGHARGMAILGMCYREGRVGLAKDESEAARWYRKAAELHETSVYCPLGWLYEKGKGGLKQDYAEALKWYRLSADAGIDGGQHNLGYMYFNGYGVKQDKAEAVKWYRKAAEQGSPGSQTALGDYYSEKKTKIDWLEAAQWYEKSAEKSSDGIPECNVGLLYDPFNEKLNDGQKAEQWYRKAAEKGLPVAMRNIGMLYKNGRGVKQSDAEAERWYRKGADRGDILSQLELGYYYGEKGSKKDWLEAVQWYEKAAGGADTTDGETEAKLGWLYDPGVGKLSDGAKAEQWYRKAAAKGSVKAMFNLGLMFENGNGVREDQTQARLWYEKAAKAGYEGARKALRNMDE